MGQLGPGAAPAVPVLIKTMKNPDRGMRITAAELLAQLGPLAKAAVSVLADVVGNDVSGTVRMRGRCSRQDWAGRQECGARA